MKAYNSHLCDEAEAHLLKSRPQMICKQPPTSVTTHGTLQRALLLLSHAAAPHTTAGVAHALRSMPHANTERLMHIACCHACVESYACSCLALMLAPSLQPGLEQLRHDT